MTTNSESRKRIAALVESVTADAEGDLIRELRKDLAVAMASFDAAEAQAKRLHDEVEALKADVVGWREYFDRATYQRDHARASLAERDATIAMVEKSLAEARGDSPSGFWTQREWEDWSNELSGLIPEDDESGRANVEAAQESIIFDVFKAYKAERDDALATIAAVEALAEKWVIEADAYYRAPIAHATATLCAKELRAALNGESA